MLQYLVFSAVLLKCCAIPYQEQRVVNGSDAELGEIPYIVSLKRNDRHTCGGSILDATHVLTAAHCVFERNPKEYIIQYGITNIDETKNKIPVHKIVWRSDYEPENGSRNDVAVITLKSSIKFSKTVKATILPKLGESTPADTAAILAGWGRNMDDSSTVKQLQRVDLEVYADENCETLHNNIANRKYHLCAGVPEGGKGQCKGDSGGPLYANGVQVGIVSWSIKPCAIKGYPGVYAKVANYVDWIIDQLN